MSKMVGRREQESGMALLLKQWQGSSSTPYVVEFTSGPSQHGQQSRMVEIIVQQPLEGATSVPPPACLKNVGKQDADGLQTEFEWCREAKLVIQLEILGVAPCASTGHTIQSSNTFEFGTLLYILLPNIYIVLPNIICATQVDKANRFSECWSPRSTLNHKINPKLLLSALTVPLMLALLTISHHVGHHMDNTTYSPQRDNSQCLLPIFTNLGLPIRGKIFFLLSSFQMDKSTKEN